MRETISLAAIEAKRANPTHRWTKLDCGHRVHHEINANPPACRKPGCAAGRGA